MKILHIGKFYAPIDGGIETINHLIACALNGNQQRIISFNNKNVSKEDDVDGIPVVRASSHGIVASQPMSWKYFKELRRSIKLFQPDIIHFHYPNPLGALYILMSGIKKSKLIVHWHSDVVAQRILHKLIKPIETLLLKKSDVIIATSPNYRDTSETLIEFKKKVVVIPCSIDEDKFILQQEDKQKIEDIKMRYGNKPIIFFVGRHVEYKGLKYLLDAEQLITQDCVIVIGGTGPLTENLKSVYKSDRIYWLGRISDEDMRLYMHAASIFAFPSITRNEAFGVALAEAMYCECAPVTFTVDASGVNWVSVSDKTGIEVPNKDSKAYAEAIDNLLSDPAKINTLAHNARFRVERMFTKGIVQKQYIELYNKLYNQ